MVLNAERRRACVFNAQSVESINRTQKNRDDFSEFEQVGHHGFVAPFALGHGVVDH